MGSPLGPVLVNIFVGYHETLIFDSTTKSCMYQRYVGDIFAIFKTKNDSEKFYNKLNLLHPSLKFTMEKVTDGTLPFLDVKIDKHNNKFLTSVKGNLLSLDNTLAETRLDRPNAKLTSLAHLFTEP